MNSDIQSIIIKAEETLQTAKFGYEDLKDKRRRMSGLRNLIVFGRSVTFVLQNLKTPVGAETFDRWYKPIQEKLKSDVVMKYFVTLRNEILKQGKLPVSTSVTANFNSDDLLKLGKRPLAQAAFL